MLQWLAVVARTSACWDALGVRRPPERTFPPCLPPRARMLCALQGGLGRLPGRSPRPLTRIASTRLPCAARPLPPTPAPARCHPAAACTTSASTPPTGRTACSAPWPWASTLSRQAGRAPAQCACLPWPACRATCRGCARFGLGPPEAPARLDTSACCSRQRSRPRPCTSLGAQRCAARQPPSPACSGSGPLPPRAGRVQQTPRTTWLAARAAHAALPCCTLPRPTQAYVPWNWHEPYPGQYEWRGWADVERWMQLIQVGHPAPGSRPRDNQAGPPLAPHPTLQNHTCVLGGEGTPAMPAAPLVGAGRRGCPPRRPRMQLGNHGCPAPAPGMPPRTPPHPLTPTPASPAAGRGPQGGAAARAL